MRDWCLLQMARSESTLSKNPQYPLSISEKLISCRCAFMSLMASESCDTSARVSSFIGSPSIGVWNYSASGAGRILWLRQYSAFAICLFPWQPRFREVSAVLVSGDQHDRFAYL